MNLLSDTVSAGLIHYLQDFRHRINQLSLSIPEDKFWFRPYPYGNSVGNLISHIVGNVEHYIGVHLANTSYVRNRDYEFSRERTESRESIMQQFDQAIDRFITVLQQQTATDWCLPYSAVGVDDVKNRFDICLRCTMHIHHHLGQLIYLRKAILEEVDT